MIKKEASIKTSYQKYARVQNKRDQSQRAGVNILTYLKLSVKFLSKKLISKSKGSKSKFSQRTITKIKPKAIIHSKSAIN